MLITKVVLQKKDKTRCSVSIDGDYEFSISIDCVVKYGIKVGAEFSERQIEEFKEESERELALKKATSYLSKAIKTKKQLITYLKGKEYSDKAIYWVVDKLKEYGVIDDAKYARAYLEHNKSEGKKLVDFKLMGKGVKKTDIETARDGFIDNSKEIAKTLAEKRLKNKEITQELLQKTYRYLLGKGFSYDEIEFALKEFRKEYWYGKNINCWTNERSWPF